MWIKIQIQIWMVWKPDKYNKQILSLEKQTIESLKLRADVCDEIQVTLFSSHVVMIMMMMIITLQWQAGQQGEPHLLEHCCWIHKFDDCVAVDTNIEYLNILIFCD